MSSKLSESDQRYKSLGFERTFDGSAGGIQWSELIEELKTNVEFRSSVVVSVFFSTQLYR